MNYYERHIGDYLKDTSHLSLLEHGIYTRLLDVYYTREGAIPAREVARLISARSDEERQALETVLAEFFRLDGESYVQARCAREIERFKERREKAANSARSRWSSAGDGPDSPPTGKGGRGRKSAPVASKEMPIADAQPMRTQCERNANASVEHGERIENAMLGGCEGNAPSNQTPVTNKPTDRCDLPREHGRSVGQVDDPPKSFGFQQVLEAFNAIGVSYHCLMRDADQARIREWISLGVDAELLSQAIADAGVSKPLAQLSTGYLDPVIKRLLFQRNSPGALHLAGGRDAQDKRDAEAAWAEVEQATREGYAKGVWRKVWSDLRTASAFKAIGEYGGRMADIGPSNRHSIKRDFVTAFCEQASLGRVA